MKQYIGWLLFVALISLGIDRHYDDTEALGTLTVTGSSTHNGGLVTGGALTDLGTTNVDITDPILNINNGGNQAGAAGAGFNIEMSDATDAGLAYDSALTSLFKIGASGSQLEVLQTSGVQVITNKDIDGGTAANNRRITMPKDTTANLNSLTRKQGTVAYDTTLDFLKFDDGSSLIQLVTPGGTQVVTNKDIDGGTAANNRRLTLSKDTTANLNGLTRKQGNIFYDTTSDTLKYDDGSSLVELTSGAAIPDSSSDIFNLGLDGTVAANAMTVPLKQSDGSTDPAVGSGSVDINFRSSTIGDGAFNKRSVTSSLSIVISSGATLGLKDALNEFIYVYALDNSGTVELAVSGSSHFDAGRLHTTTAMGSGADSRDILYSTTLRSDVPIRLIGRLVSNQTTSGTYTVAPTEISILPFNVDSLGVWTSFTPILTGASGGSPAVGNGSLNGKYKIDADGFMDMTINFVIGSTTVFGAGRVEFSLPPGVNWDDTRNPIHTNTEYPGYGTLTIFDSGAQIRNPGTHTQRGLTKMQLIDSGFITSTNPITFTTADEITVYVQNAPVVGP